MLENEFHKTLSKRLHYLCGQLNGIDKMLQQNRSAGDMLVQLLAVESGLHKLIYQHFDDALRKDLAAQINTLLEEKPLTAKSFERLINIKKQFPNYKLKQLPKIIYEVKQIELRKGK